MARTIAFVLTVTALAASSVADASGDWRRGLEKSQVCQSCHGKTGNESLQPSYPILAGQHADYLEHALKAYRSGDRQNAIMSGFAAGLSDQDIADIAAWYARQDGLTDLSID
jgi:cytochrome c553